MCRRSNSTNFMSSSFIINASLEDELRREKIKTLKLEFDVRRLEDIIEDKASIVHNMTTDISSIEAENQSLRNSLQNYISNNMVYI